MRLAEHGGEGQIEKILAIGAADMDHPIAPVFSAGRVDHRMHDLGGPVSRLGQAGHRGAVAIDQRAVQVGAVKIDLDHMPLLLGAIRMAERYHPKHSRNIRAEPGKGIYGDWSAPRSLKV